jgi:hypothetical protein
MAMRKHRLMQEISQHKCDSLRLMQHGQQDTPTRAIPAVLPAGYDQRPTLL